MEIAERMRCPCGHEHGRRWPWMRRRLAEQIRRFGAEVLIVTPAGGWWVPRVWLAFHAWVPAQLPHLAARHGWRALARPAAPDPGPLHQDDEGVEPQQA